MANYSVAPYAFSFNPRHARGGERRPIDDVDARGTTARSVIDAVLKRLEGESLHPHAIDETKSIRVARLISGSEYTFVEFGVARSGVVGSVHRKRGPRVHYGADESNETRTRSLFIYPTGGHEVYWLNERAGQASAYSHVDQFFLSALRDTWADVTTKISPVAEWSAVKSWASQVSVNEIRFDAPRPGGSTQAMDVNGIHADVRIIVKPHGSLTLNRLVKEDGPDRQAVFGFLSDTPVTRATDRTADSVMEEGWRATVAFKTRGGRQRSFGLALDDTAPTLIYPVGTEEAGRPRSFRPLDREFVEACGDFLDDVQGRLPAPVSVVADILKQVG